jgi:putative transposase
MSRIARIVLENIPYHLTQRGNARQQVFCEPQDYRLYLDLLRNYSEDAHLRLWAYCLMPNHVHLIAVPERPEAMASALGRTHADFARHFNLRRRTCGHVWQARFFSCPLESAHLWRAAAYIERNPSRARIVEHPGEYPWSSAPVHLGLTANAGFLDLSAWQADYTPHRWSTALAMGVDEEAFGRRLQEASRRGRPLGSDEFAQDLEKQTSRTLRPRPAGRPRKRPHRDEGQLSLEIGV